jgi:hypothetical protein
LRPTLLPFLIVLSTSVVARAQESTIRHELTRAGFELAAGAPGHPDVDRPLTSSGFSSRDGTFAGAFYYADDPKGPDGLPLRVAAFNRSNRRWLVANLDEQLSRKRLETGFSVMAVQISSRYIVFETHATPSAAFAVVLDRRLNAIASLGGFDARILGDGTIAFIGNMVHFAPTHQSSLWLWDPGSMREVEVFGGDPASPLAERYRRSIQDFYARLPDKDRKGYEESNYGPVEDFDRDLSHRVHSTDGNRVAMIARYSCDRLYWSRGDDLLTLVTCNRRRSGEWACVERDLDVAARQYGVALPNDVDGFDAALESLARVALGRR